MPVFILLVPDLDGLSQPGRDRSAGSPSRPRGLRRPRRVRHAGSRCGRAARGVWLRAERGCQGLRPPGAAGAHRRSWPNGPAGVFRKAPCGAPGGTPLDPAPQRPVDGLNAFGVLGGKPWQELHSHGAEESLDLPPSLGDIGPAVDENDAEPRAHQFEVVRAERRSVVAIEASRNAAPPDGLPEHRQESADGLGEGEGAKGTTRVASSIMPMR